MSIKIKVKCGNCSTPQSVVFLRPIEAQAKLGVSEQTFNKYRQWGYLEGHDFGRGYLYTQDQLDSGIRELRKADQQKNVEIIYRD